MRTPEARERARRRMIESNAAGTTGGRRITESALTREIEKESRRIMKDPKASPAAKNDAMNRLVKLGRARPAPERSWLVLTLPSADEARAEFELTGAKGLFVLWLAALCAAYDPQTFGPVVKDLTGVDNLDELRAFVPNDLPAALAMALKLGLDNPRAATVSAASEKEARAAIEAAA